MGDHFALPVANDSNSGPPAMVPALRWEELPEGPIVILLDQIRIPAEEIELVCTDVQTLVEAIRTLTVRGAPLLGLNVPFIVVAPTTTIDLDTPDGSSIEIEQHPGREVTEISFPQAPVAEAGGDILVAPLESQAYNPAFDVTPPALITAIGTDNGVASPLSGATLAVLCPPCDSGHDQVMG